MSDTEHRCFNCGGIATHFSTATEDGKDDAAPLYLCRGHTTLALIAGWRPKPINPPVDPASDWS